MHRDRTVTWASAVSVTPVVVLALLLFLQVHMQHLPAEGRENTSHSVDNESTCRGCLLNHCTKGNTNENLQGSP